MCEIKDTVRDPVTGEEIQTLSRRIGTKQHTIVHKKNNRTNSKTDLFCGLSEGNST